MELEQEAQGEKCKESDSLEGIHLTRGEGPQTPPRSPSLLVRGLEITEDQNKEDGEEEKEEKEVPEEMLSKEAVIQDQMGRDH